MTSNSWETCGSIAGRCFRTNVDGSVCGPRRGRGLREEPVRTVFSTQVSPSIALSIDNTSTVWSSNSSPPRPSPVPAPKHRPVLG